MQVNNSLCYVIFKKEWLWEKIVCVLLIRAVTHYLSSAATVYNTVIHKRCEGVSEVCMVMSAHAFVRQTAVFRHLRSTHTTDQRIGHLLHKLILRLTSCLSLCSFISCVMFSGCQYSTLENIMCVCERSYRALWMHYNTLHRQRHWKSSKNIKSPSNKKLHFHRSCAGAHSKNRLTNSDLVW